jgi:hypothetical protein
MKFPSGRIRSASGACEAVRYLSSFVLRRHEGNFPHRNRLWGPFTRGLFLILVKSDAIYPY